jgi:hypothetical protein
MMGFRFYRRVRVFPGLSVNLSRSGPSLSVGVRGAHVTFGRRGIRRTVGIPGTGIYWTSSSGHHTGVHSGAGQGGGWLAPLILLTIIVAILIALAHSG